jgi:hypothetical protein
MKKRTEDELSRYLHNHLVYEVEKLRSTYDRLGTRLTGPDFDMVIENFALHARNLVDFLSPSKEARKSKNAVYAALYVPGFRPLKTKIDKTLGKLNAQILHSSSERTTNVDDKFHTNLATNLLDWIEDKLAEFNEALPSNFGNWMPPGQSPARLPVTQHPSATNFFTTTKTYVTGAMTNIKRAKPKT